MYTVKTMDTVKQAIHALSQNPRIFIFLRRILENNFKGERSVLKKYFVCAPDERVLDIGCGTGEFSVFFNPEMYTGVDIEKKYIDYAKKNYKGTFLAGDATTLPFKDGSFQKIVIVGVLHHLDDETSGRVLKEMSRVLAPNGELLIMEDVNRSDNNVITRLLHRLDNGEFIRDKEGYEKLLSERFLVKRTFNMQSGLSPYQVFILGK
ncbi:MAG: class I SAM-dependent methyltransferase [Parcubacteria group bacterium]|nr:class I SAM-dependent methyltransferase [Parcubacteria group bacterium]